MSLPAVVAVNPGSPAARAGLVPGDQIVSMDGHAPRDVIEYQLLADQDAFEIELRRGGVEVSVHIERDAGESLGMQVDSALFDRVRTCDNHCAFCFIHQLPKGMRKSLYVRDDDYRLSFLYGNFTTLTRFNELDLERVIDEGLSPLWVSIHATDPEVRASMLRNRRGATSLRWLRALLDNGVSVHGQVVVCPGVNDGAVLESTFADIMDLYPELTSVACVPLGVSRWNVEASMRAHSPAEARAVVDAVEDWQGYFKDALGHPMVFASDEFYLQAGRYLPPLSHYGEVAQHENGVGLVRLFEARFFGMAGVDGPRPGGFFASVDAAPASGYRAPRTQSETSGVAVAIRPRCGGPAPLEEETRMPVSVLTGEYASGLLESLVASVRPDAQVIAVPNRYFGGNIAVAGLLTGADIARALSESPPGRRFLLPDVCLSSGVFLDGISVAELPRPVEVVATDGAALRRALLGGAE
jgi:putative radical SAM enzyme (TIGR03279 family)